MEIPNSIKTIKKGTNVSCCQIPASVEIIEDDGLLVSGLKTIKFEEGSKLKSFGKCSLIIKELIINNDYFKTMDNGVVISLNSCGIFFVPRDLKELVVDPNVEVIHYKAFMFTNIKSLVLPKRLQQIDYSLGAKIESITFEEGIELDFVGVNAFSLLKIQKLKLPPIKGTLNEAIILRYHQI